MPLPKNTTEIERLKALEIDLVNAYCKAVECGVNMATTLIGAALEDVGKRIEAHHGAVSFSLDQISEYNN